jgi:hypothetical protein
MTAMAMVWCGLDTCHDCGAVVVLAAGRLPCLIRWMVRCTQQYCCKDLRDSAKLPDVHCSGDMTWADYLPCAFKVPSFSLLPRLLAPQLQVYHCTPYAACMHLLLTLFAVHAAVRMPCFCADCTSILLCC